MLITNQQELDKFCTHIAEEKVIAIDTEFIREKSYYPILSLIQIATSEQIAAIDVLAGLNLNRVLNTIIDPTVLKIFHAARQDIEVIYNHFKKVPINIFDTQIAAQFIGFDNPPSYEKLVQTYCGESVSKQYQFSNWQSRPLSIDQIKYALGDVTYLIKIKDLLTAEISHRNLFLLDWLDEENKALENYIYKPTQPIDHLGKFLNSSKSVQSLSRIYVLLRVREELSEKLNKPRNFIFRDEKLIEMTKQKQIDEQMLAKLGITYQNLLKEAENPNVHKIVKDFIKKTVKPTAIDAAIYQKLKSLLMLKAEQYGIAPSLIANRNDLNLLAINKAIDSKVSYGWRKIAYGQEALAIVLNSPIS